MKTINQIKDEYAQSKTYEDWDDLITRLVRDKCIGFIDIHIQEVSKLVAMEALKNASKSIKIGETINKIQKSILNEKNIPEL